MLAFVVGPFVKIVRHLDHIDDEGDVVVVVNRLCRW